MSSFAPAAGQSQADFIRSIVEEHYEPRCPLNIIDNKKQEHLVYLLEKKNTTPSATSIAYRYNPKGSVPSFRIHSDIVSFFKPVTIARIEVLHVNNFDDAEIDEAVEDANKKASAKTTFEHTSVNRRRNNDQKQDDEQKDVTIDAETKTGGAPPPGNKAAANQVTTSSDNNIISAAQALLSVANQLMTAFPTLTMEDAVAIVAAKKTSNPTTNNKLPSSSTPPPKKTIDKQADTLTSAEAQALITEGNDELIDDLLHEQENVANQNETDNNTKDNDSEIDKIPTIGIFTNFSINPKKMYLLLTDILTRGPDASLREVEDKELTQFVDNLHNRYTQFKNDISNSTVSKHYGLDLDAVSHAFRHALISLHHVAQTHPKFFDTKDTNITQIRNDHFKTLHYTALSLWCITESLALCGNTNNFAQSCLGPHLSAKMNNNTYKRSPADIILTWKEKIHYIFIDHPTIVWTSSRPLDKNINYEAQQIAIALTSSS